MDHQRNYVYPTATRPISGGHPPRSQAPTTRRRPSSTNNLQKPIPTRRRASMMRETARANASARGISLLANAEDRRASLAKNSSSRRGGDSFPANAKNRTSMRDSSHNNNRSMRDSSHNNNNASFRGSLATSRRASVSASNGSLHHSSMKDFSTASMRNLTDQQRVAIGRRRTQTLQDILLMDSSAAAAQTHSRTSIMQLDHSGGTNTTSSSSDKAKRSKPERSRSRGSIIQQGRSNSLRIPRNDSSHSMLDASIDLKLTNSKEQPLEVPATNKAKRSSMPNSRRSSLPKNSNHHHHHNKRSSLPTSASTPNLEQQHQQHQQHRSSSIGGFSTEKFITDVTAPNRRRIGEKPTQETCDDGLFWIKRDGVKSFKKLKKSTSQPNAFLRRPSPSLKKKIYKGYLNWRQS